VVDGNITMLGRQKALSVPKGVGNSCIAFYFSQQFKIFFRKNLILKGSLRLRQSREILVYSILLVSWTRKKAICFWFYRKTDHKGGFILAPLL